MFDHFGIHQNVPTQELFGLFINITGITSFTSKQYVTGLYVTDHCICLCWFDSVILCWRSI